MLYPAELRAPCVLRRRRAVGGAPRKLKRLWKPSQFGVGAGPGSPDLLVDPDAAGPAPGSSVPPRARA